MISAALTGSGIVPFVAFSHAGQRLIDHDSLYLHHVRKLVNRSQPFDQTSLQLTYGAAILSFLGGPHWGFAFSEYATTSKWVKAGRLGWGVMPSLIAWPFINCEKNLAIDGLSAGLATAFCVDGACAAARLLPSSYFRLRIIPTTFGILCMQSNHDRFSK